MIGQTGQSVKNHDEIFVTQAMTSNSDIRLHLDCYLTFSASPPPSSTPPSPFPFQQKRAEFQALQEEHDAQNAEVSTRGNNALADFMTGASDMKSPARMHTLATVMEESSPTSSTASEFYHGRYFRDEGEVEINRTCVCACVRAYMSDSG